MYTWLKPLPIVLIALGSATGCLMIEEEPLDVDIGSTQSTLVTENALTDNALTWNALTWNALTWNALTWNALQPNVFELNYASAGDLHTTLLGRQLLKYTTRCAYSSGEALAVDDATLGPAQYGGNLGLASVWKTGALNEDYREVMTACLLAHLNYFGESITLSVRFGSSAPPPAAETNSYYYGDAAYYGNLYADPPEKYACTIRQKAGETPDATSPTADKRICDITGNCGVTNVGYCDEVCDTIVQDGSQWKFLDCHDGQPVGSRKYYPHTFSVWLQGTDAPTCQPGNNAWTGFTCKPN